jgi:hypothetical protein
VVPSGRVVVREASRAFGCPGRAIVPTAGSHDASRVAKRRAGPDELPLVRSRCRQARVRCNDADEEDRHRCDRGGASPVCRFYIPPEPGGSHFYGRGSTECETTGANNPSFVPEDAQRPASAAGPAIRSLTVPRQNGGVAAGHFAPRTAGSGTTQRNTLRGPKLPMTSRVSFGVHSAMSCT